MWNQSALSIPKRSRFSLTEKIEERVEIKIRGLKEVSRQEMIEIW